MYAPNDPIAPETRPYATVVVRSFNRLDELSALVPLQLDQTYPNFEVLIIDSSHDASEASVKAALGIGDPRVRVVHTPPRGCAAASNEAARRARGEILVFVDD